MSSTSLSHSEVWKKNCIKCHEQKVICFNWSFLVYLFYIPWQVNVCFDQVISFLSFAWCISFFITKEWITIYIPPHQILETVVVSFAAFVVVLLLHSEINIIISCNKRKIIGKYSCFPKHTSFRGDIIFS